MVEQTPQGHDPNKTEAKKVTVSPSDESLGILSAGVWPRGANELKRTAAEKDIRMFQLGADMRSLAPENFEGVIARPFLAKRAGEILVPVIEGANPQELAKLESARAGGGRPIPAELRLDLLANGRLLLGDQLPINTRNLDDLIKEIARTRTERAVNQENLGQYTEDLAALALIDPTLLQRREIKPLYEMMREMGGAHVQHLKQGIGSYSANRENAIAQAGAYSIVYPEMQEYYSLSGEQIEETGGEIRNDLNNITQNAAASVARGYHNAARLKFLMAPHKVEKDQLSFYPPYASQAQTIKY